jgi:hypothetical protein
MIDSPEVAGDYYHKIADRIAVGPKSVIEHISY